MLLFLKLSVNIDIIGIEAQNAYTCVVVSTASCTLHTMLLTFMTASLQILKIKLATNFFVCWVIILQLFINHNITRALCASKKNQFYYLVWLASH